MLFQCLHDKINSCYGPNEIDFLIKNSEDGIPYYEFAVLLAQWEI